MTRTQKQLSAEADLPSEKAPSTSFLRPSSGQPGQSEETDDPWRQLRHEINGSLTSILMNCELLLESDCAPTERRRIEAILSQALRIDQFLHHFQRS